ncbi:MAG: sulfotransferase family protein [Actinomycetota bacterium]
MDPESPSPLFLIGAPRSGTSLLYKVLCLHPGVSWISNWVRRFPAVPALSALNRLPSRLPPLQRLVWFGGDSNAYVYGRRRALLERLFPMPVEGEPLFARAGIPEHPPGETNGRAPPYTEQQLSALRGTVRAIRRFSGARHFVNKRIANNQRIPLLLAAFPSARFVDLTRDGRAVAYSLSKVDWWPDSVVWWYGDTPKRWEADGGDPWELCARSWVEELASIESGLSIVPTPQALRITYEGFVADPIATILGVASFAGLPDDPRWLRRLDELSFPNRNEAWRNSLDPEAVATIEQVQSEELARQGYS